MNKFFNKNIVCFFLLLISTITFAQKTKKSTNKLFEEAMEFAEYANYNEAIYNFKQILSIDSMHIDALYNMGLCYLNTSNGADTAVICFKDGLSKLNESENRGYVGNELRLSLAEAHQVMLEPNKAISLYNEILNSSSELDSLTRLYISKEINVCNNASFFIQNPIEIEIINLGSNINSIYDDHSPLVAIDEKELIFTSRRKWIKLPLLEDGQFAEKIYSVSLDKNNWESAKLLSMFFKHYEHESAASISPDGRKIVLFRNDEHGKSLYWSKYDGTEWTHPEKFPEPINSHYEETHGSLSSDMNSFYFTSDRPNGYGGLDIYICNRLESGGWSEPRNLGPQINSEYDEETPQIHYDGKTLYFSSEGHNSMGKLDVFYSEKQDDEEWSIPVNMGYPINTPDDDFFFTPTINKSRAYYASSRFSDNYGGSDIYVVKFKHNSNTELAVVEGVIDSSLGEDYSKMRVLVTRTEDNKLIREYRPDEEDGKYMLFLEVGDQYSITEENNSEEITKYINATEELSYMKTKHSVPFVDIAMAAPLKRELEPMIIPTPIIDELEIIDHKTSLLTELSKQEVKSIIAKNTNAPENKNLKIKSTEEVDGYTIQVYALKLKRIKDFSLFASKGIKNVKEHNCNDGYTRYTIGHFTTLSETKAMKNKLLKSGYFTDLWVRPNKDVYSLRVKK